MSPIKEVYSWQDMAGRLSVKGGPLPSASRGHSSIGASTGVHPCEVGPDEKIRAVVYDKWKTIQKKCKDHNNSSKTSVPSSVFLGKLVDLFPFFFTILDKGGSDRKFFVLVWV